MQAADAIRTSQRRPAASRPDVNLYDMPEMMPGAHPGANPVQRERFESRCKTLHRAAEEEEREASDELRAASGEAAKSSDLESMFPSLDPALVRMLYAEAQSPQAAIETLLALAAATNEPGAPMQRAASPPPRDLGVKDISKFPSLVDADGWQITSRRQLESDPNADLGSAWCERAKAGAAAPAPAPSQGQRAPMGAWGQRRKEKAKESEDQADQTEWPTDYEARHQAGQRRALKRAQYGRLRGVVKGSGPRQKIRAEDDSSAESAAEDELVGGIGAANEEGLRDYGASHPEELAD